VEGREEEEEEEEEENKEEEGNKEQEGQHEEEEDKEGWCEAVERRDQALEEQGETWEREEEHESLYPECTSLDFRDSVEVKSFDIPESPRPLSQETRNLTASELLLNKSVILLLLLLLLILLMIMTWPLVLVFTIHTALPCDNRQSNERKDVEKM